MRDLLLARVTQFLKDNGAADICKTYAGPLTDYLLLGLPAPVTGLVLKQGGSRKVLKLSTRTIAGELTFTGLPENVEAIEAYFFIPGQQEPAA